MRRAASIAVGMGYRPLFNGGDLEGWTWRIEKNPPAPSWAAEDETLRTTAGKRDLPHNPEGPDRIEAVALEYQIAKDERRPDAFGRTKHATAALYEYRPAQKTAPAKADVWHTGRIVAQRLHIEH